MQPADIVRAARGFLGVRFRHQGRDPKHGLDCLGLLIAVSETLQLNWPAVLQTKMQERDYPHLPNEAYLRESLEVFLVPSNAPQPQPGEIALLRVFGRAQHLAILADDAANGSRSMIHAYAPARKVVEHVLDAHWQQAMVMRYRLPMLH